METISPLVPTMRRAACWTVVTKDGRFAYLTNGGTGDVTGLRIDQDGSISLLRPSGVDATVGGAAVDAAISESSRFLYVRNGALAKIDAFRIEGDGSLTWIGAVAGLPATAAGSRGTVGRRSQHGRRSRNVAPPPESASASGL